MSSAPFVLNTRNYPLRGKNFKKKNLKTELKKKPRLKKRRQLRKYMKKKSMKESLPITSGSNPYMTYIRTVYKRAAEEAHEDQRPACARARQRVPADADC